MKIFKYRLLNHILFWIFIYFFYTLPSVIMSGVWWPMAAVNLTYIPFDILMTYFIIEYLIPKFLFKRNLLLFILGSIAAMAANFLISQYIKYYIHPHLGIWTSPRPIWYDLFYSLLSMFMIAGTASTLKLLTHSYKIQIKQSEVERRGVQSELGMLRSQVNPHFLFNVLNNIDSLIYEDKEKASNAIFLLSKIMRFMLQESVQEKVLLEKEVSYIEDYLELAKLSFENPGFLKFNTQGPIGGKTVPPLLFIPLIENAIKHSNKLKTAPGIIIKIAVNHEFIEMTTSNFIKQNDFILPGTGTGIGLKNVRKRLELLYPENYTFDTKKVGDKFEVVIKVPLV